MFSENDEKERVFFGITKIVLHEIHFMILVTTQPISKH